MAREDLIVCHDERVIRVTTSGDTDLIEVWFSEDEVSRGIYGRYLNFRSGNVTVKVGMGEQTIDKAIAALRGWKERKAKEKECPKS